MIFINLSLENIKKLQLHRIKYQKQSYLCAVANKFLKKIQLGVILGVMKKILTLLLLFLCICINAQTSDIPGSVSPIIEPKDYLTIADIMPVFPGCEMLTNKDERFSCSEMQFIRFIELNIMYPKQALEMGCEGVVYISFIINKEGMLRTSSIIWPQAAGSVHPGSVTPSLLLLEERPAAHTLHIGRAAVRPLLVWTVLRVTGADASPGLCCCTPRMWHVHARVDVCVRFLASSTQAPLRLGFLVQVQNCQPKVLNIRSS